MNKIDPNKHLPNSNVLITFVTKEPEAYMGVFKDGTFKNLTKGKDEEFKTFEPNEIQYWIK